MWVLAATVGLKLIEFFITEKARRDQMKKQMFEFVKRFDSSVIDNVKLKNEYAELIRRSETEEKKL